MPVFISYSHADRETVERIAKELVKANVHVWVDRWELQFGDSLIERIQEAISDASVLLIMISKNSIASEWCRKELNAGLIKELEERRVVTIPVLLEDCEIPLFLRDKYRADFRGNFDQELKRLQDSLLRFTDVSLNRVENPKFHIDWAIDHGIKDDHLLINVDSVSFSKEQEFSVLCNIQIWGNPKSTGLYQTADARGLAYGFINDIVDGLFKMPSRPDLRILITDEHPQRKHLTSSDPRLGYTFEIVVVVRRLGINSGMDLLFDFGSILQLMLEKRQAISKTKPAAS